MDKRKVILIEDETPDRTVSRQMSESRGDLFERAGKAEVGRDGLSLNSAVKPQLDRTREEHLRLEQSALAADRDGFRALLLDLDLNSLRFPIERREELKLWQFAGVNVLNELLGGKGPHKVIALDKGRFLALFASAPEKDDPALPEQVLHAFRSFLKLSGFALQCVFGGSIASRTAELKRLSAAPYPFFYGGTRTVRYEEWEASDRFASVPEAKRRIWTKALKQALLESHLTGAAMEQANAALHREAAEQRWEPEQIKSLYSRIFLDVCRFTGERDEGAEIEEEFRWKLDQCQTFFAVCDTIAACFRKLRERRGDEKKIDSSIARLLQRMHEDLSYPYKLEELAASVNYSVPYFSAMFKKTTGESFIQYLTRLRIEKAKLLLITTDLKTFEIAEAVGLENYRSFNRIFKRDTGLSPSEFRRAEGQG